MAFHSEYMKRAVALARKYLPSPNPRVGAVIVKKGRIVGEGAHEKPGCPHAEINALSEAKDDAKGAELYVTLEPCVHVGRTGPCVKAIEKAGIRKVYIGLKDPDERVNGQGIQYLRNIGIEVETGIDEPECHRLLEGYITHRTQGRPFVTLKAAITLDGYLATNTYDSKWISSSKSRKIAHELRADNDAILVGINTVEKDNPLLTVRDANGVSPKRVVLDSTLRIEKDAKIIKSAAESHVFLVHSHATTERQELFANKKGVSLIQAADDSGNQVDLHKLMAILANQGILTLLVEGGSAIHTSFLKAHLVDQIILFIAPKILGRGIPFTTFPGAKKITEGLSLSVEEITPINDDVYYRAKINYPS